VKIWIAAVLIGLAGCTQPGGGGDGGEGAAAVQPSRVTAEELRAAVSDPRVRAFYEARNWAPAWTADQSRALTEAFGGANRHALDPRLYLDPIQQAAAPAAREAALTLAAIHYAEALAKGRVDPTRLGRPYTLPRPEVDIGAGLARAIEGNDVADWLSGLAPQDDDYRLLSEAYLQAVRQTARPAPVPAGAPIRPGSSDPRIGAVANALVAAGYYRPPQGQSAPAAARRYGPELVAAVRTLQEDYGLTASGLIGEATLAALNDSAQDRARTLAVNLERRRWVARGAPETRIDVNIAAAELSYWRDGTLANRRRAVVGEPGNETPQLGSPMFRLVANPTWTVPRSIQREEIEPQGAAYLARNNMEMRDGWVVQKSGPRNSLGLVKFDMRNEHAIYLHDTPAKALFGEDLRLSSHGCVRVQDALGFAAMLAADQGVTSQWDEARAGGEEGFVPLPHPIPVRLFYQTAFVDGGRVRYRLDAYGWDNDVARALGLANRPRYEFVNRRRDLGP
jgi:murein L,D-transpeptidase YcbB/YkuD